MVARKDTWVKDLSGYLKERRSQPFEWGKNDCLKFAAGAVHALTGEDFSKDFPDYSTEEEAKEIMEMFGGVKEIISLYLGQGDKNILSAKRGDIVLLKIPEIVAGVVDDTGQNIAVVTPNGLTRTYLKRAIHHWSY